MQKVYASLFAAIDGKPNTKGTEYHLNMLSTTCHIYFGKMLGATPNGRLAELPVSDGTSPSHGADRNGPTAVTRSAAKIDHLRTGGTLLNQKQAFGARRRSTAQRPGSSAGLFRSPVQSSRRKSLGGTSSIAFSKTARMEISAVRPVARTSRGNGRSLCRAK